MGRNGTGRLAVAAGLALAACALGCADADEAAAAAEPTTSGPAEAAGAALDLPVGAVIVNGVALAEDRLRELHERYGRGPRPGRWWYDARSGLVGLEGGPALGWLHAGHDLGPLRADASGGDTGVFLNRRELDAADDTRLAGVLGTPLQPGRYWLDARGDYGVEGRERPLGNLYVLLQMRQAAPGGGDPWSARFSAGSAADAERTAQCPAEAFGSYVR